MDRLDDHLEGWKKEQREKARQELVRRLEDENRRKVQKCIEELGKILYPKEQ